MGRVVIPKRFKDKLGEDSFVYTLCNNVENILDLPMIYFREYTKHDESHINNILKISDALIANETLAALSKNAVEILVASCIIHDLGMFIQKDGVESLLFGRHKGKKIALLDKLTWGEAWTDFYKKARRYNSHQLKSLFGDNPPPIHLPEDHVDDANENWRVYGEFLRRYHPRIACDIVYYGFMGNIDTDIIENCAPENPTFTKDMIGLICQSHGMSLRATYGYIESLTYVRKESSHFPLGVPVYYLMSVLRLADYLHAGKKRAPIIRLTADTVDSPLSRNEFMWNQAVDGLSEYSDKPSNVIYER